MSQIRAVYFGSAPGFPPRDQHPDAQRYGPITMPDGLVVFVDAIGSLPSIEQIGAVIGEHAAAKTLATSAKLEEHLTGAISEFSAPVPTTAEGKPVMTTSSPGAHALTIKQVLEEHGKKLDQVLQTQLQLLRGELDGQLGSVVTGTEAVIARVRGHTDDFNAILGQFTNDIG